ALEAAAVAPEAIVHGAVAPETHVTASPLPGPAPTTSAAKPDPAVQFHSLAKRDAKPPSAKVPAGAPVGAPVSVKAKRDAG
ncbi:MAG TPA: hypothetical protein VHT52_05025, partial [Stellaceae bacterium]|nr:hypothetical protein [Stellaceae bacterium]